MASKTAAVETSARHHRVRRRFTISAIAVGAIFALAGVIFTVNAQLAENGTERYGDDLASLVRAQQARNAELQEQNDALQSDVDALLSANGGATAGTNADVDSAKLQALADSTGRAPVHGPGLSVTLNDAPTSAINIAGVTADDIVVHQQDLQAVINALWAGGAEAMTIQGQRVTSETAVRCVGNTLMLHGVTYSPPYTIAAIGDSVSLKKALNASPEIDIYLEYVDALGLGWSVDVKGDQQFPAYEGNIEMKYATVIPGTDIFGPLNSSSDGSENS